MASRRRRFTLPDRKGLSLLEVLIGLFIFALLLTGLLQLFISGQQYFINQNVQSSMLEESRLPMSWIARDVKQAVDVASSWSGYTTSGTVLVLRVPSLDAYGVIIDETQSFDHVVYRIDQGRLQRVYDALGGVSAKEDASRYLAADVLGLGFTYFDGDNNLMSTGFSGAASVKADLTVQRQGFLRTFQENMNSKFKLRNK